jgi:16S rRNA (guanine966-N2)-methyltransferase
MRIVGGKLKGRSLRAPSGRETRPTSDRVREAIFNILTHGVEGFTIEGARVLDLFAGTGALGLEALSRGARFCQFVDESAEARGLIRQNADELGLVGQCKIWRRDATRLGRAAPQPPFDLVFADPPYGKGMGEKALISLVSDGWLAEGAIVVLEESSSAEIAQPVELSLIDRRPYGDTQVVFYRRPNSLSISASLSST